MGFWICFPKKEKDGNKQSVTQDEDKTPREDDPNESVMTCTRIIRNKGNDKKPMDETLEREYDGPSCNTKANSQVRANGKSKKDQDSKNMMQEEKVIQESQPEDAVRGYVVISFKNDVIRNGFKARMEKYKHSLKSDDGNVIDFERKFADEVEKRKVVLEDIFVSGREVSFLIAVSNHEPNPKVTVRFSTDFWESVLNEDAKPFNASKDDDQLFQRFYVTLSVPNAKWLEFAVRSMGDLGTFWDNHNYCNFKVESVMENVSPSDLIAKFTPLKECMFDDLVKRRPVELKNASLTDEKVVVTIATKESSTDLPGIRYTLDNWKSFTDVTSVESKGQDTGRNVSEIQLDIPKETKMIFAIFWRHGGIEYWDNNNRRDFEIQA